MNKDYNKPRPIDDFLVKEISENVTKVKGKKTTIFFRDDKRANRIRQVYRIPIDYLRFRKDNGRISSDVNSYENKNGNLIEGTDLGQQILRDFLKEKDIEATKELKRTIIDRGQDEPAVITCDGFLINGNRRKMALELLSLEFPSEAKYKELEVVILPGKRENDNDEMPPSHYEIEQIESAYQFHNQGKSEYTNFDKALSIRRKLRNGMSIVEQLSYDATFNMLEEKDKKKKITQIEEDFLKPLECIDKYLKRLNRSGMYDTIATAKGSQKGQWQAFIDYYKSVDKNLRDPSKLNRLNVTKNERGTVESIAFKIIRARTVQGVDKKAHELMRLLPKLLKNDNSKAELFKLKDINLKMQDETATDTKDAEIKDLQWYAKNREEIIHYVRNSKKIYDGNIESETPKSLLMAALGKLNHDDMKLEVIERGSVKSCLQLAEQVKDRADKLKHDLYLIYKGSKSNHKV